MFAGISTEFLFLEKGEGGSLEESDFKLMDSISEELPKFVLLFLIFTEDFLFNVDGVVFLVSTTGGFVLLELKLTTGGFVLLELKLTTGGFVLLELKLTTGGFVLLELKLTIEGFVLISLIEPIALEGEDFLDCNDSIIVRSYITNR